MTLLLFMLPLTVFLIFIAPLWLFLHYRSVNKLRNERLNDADLEEIKVLVENAQGLSQRVTVLESILDAQVPKWREHV